jgi:hypothetical protein
MRLYAGKFLIAAVLAAASLSAQEPESGPDGSAKTTVPGVTILAVPGRPFSGIDNIEWTRTGDDGSTVTKHLQAQLARDSQGRVYREHHRFIAGNSQERSPMTYISISDPITRTRMTCYLQIFVCNLYAYVPQTVVYPSAIGPLDNEARYRTRESLGTDQYEGFDVTRSKEVTTTRAGAIGNDRDLVETREFWYSEALQTNLKIVRNDSLTGKQVVYVTDISVSEPNPELFRVPVGYSVHDMRRHVRGAAYGNP